MSCIENNPCINCVDFFKGLNKSHSGELSGKRRSKAAFTPICSFKTILALIIYIQELSVTSVSPMVVSCRESPRLSPSIEIRAS